MENTKSNNSSSSITMADLMHKHVGSFSPLHRGDIIKGKITKLTPHEILMDINFKTEALVIEKDKKLLKNLLSVVHLGDEVSAYVLSPESDKGNPVVTLRHFVEDKIWDILTQLQKKQEKIKATITELTRGGFVVEAEDGISGFLPNVHMSTSRHGEDLVGETIEVLILELNRELKKIIFSQKATLSTDEFKKAVQAIHISDKVIVTVTGVSSFGLFVSVPLGSDQNLDGLVHISEIGWETTDPSELSEYSVGQQIEVVIVGFDERAKRVDLSIKRLTKDPFEETTKEFSLDKKVSGTITAIDDNGAQIELSSADGTKVAGLIRKEKIPPTIKYKVGQEITATVSQIDKRKKKIILVPVLLEKPIGYR